MTTAIFKKAILLSVLAHITIFGIFTFSFGNKLIKLDYTQVAFLGRILENYDLNSHLYFSPSTKGLPLRLPIFKQEASANLIPQWENTGWEKPVATLTSNTQKIILASKPATLLSQTKREDRVITMYPQLSHNFLLYFKDRQAVHIELAFNIMSDGKTNYIAVKRKISSGNLEADLLVMRYINHYLFIQQANFSQNNWQRVKIDLSTRQ